jgi:hypothetical protein
MKGRSLFTIIATIILAWAIWSGAIGDYFAKKMDPDSPVFLKIEKIVKPIAAVPQHFHNTSEAFDNLFRAIFSDIGGPVLVQQCKDKPVFFGTLSIVFGVSACGVFFVIHMIRTDSRFN